MIADSVNDTLSRGRLQVKAVRLYDDQPGFFRLVRAQPLRCWYYSERSRQLSLQAGTILDLRIDSPARRQLGGARSRARHRRRNTRLQITGASTHAAAHGGGGL